MKLKTLVAVVALAATGTANAAITQVAAPQGSDLFVSIINPGATAAEDQSFHLNLNMQASSFDGNTAYSWDLVSLTGGLYSQFAGETDLRFTVAGSNVDNNNFGPTYGNYVTATSTPAYVNTLGDVQTFGQVMDEQIVLANTAASGGDYAIVNRGDQGFYEGTGTSTWGDTVFGTNMSATIGEMLDFYFILPTGLTETQVTQFAGQWSLSDTGVLSYSAVPVPAAVWLFGSGLVGLISIARRRKA